MTVKELRDILDSFSPGCEVVLSRDSEGNAFSPLAGYSGGYYVAASSWRGDVHDDIKEAEAAGVYQRVLVLWTTN